MIEILWVTTPFFALILAGYWATKSGRLSLQAIPGLNNFVLYFALPCMLFRFGATTDMVSVFNPTLAVLYIAVSLCVVITAIGLTLSSRMGWNDAALGALVAAFPNSGFMGVPLLIGLLGTSMASPVILSITIDMISTSSLCIALSRLDGHGLRSMGPAIKNALKGVLGNPMAWAILLGALFSVMQLKLPAPIEKTVWMLADAASPVALFTIGSVLARGQLQAHERPQSVSGVWPIVILKLVVHPALIMLLGMLLMQLGADLTWSSLVALVLVAALPSASNVSLLAERFGADNLRIARIILITTVIAFFTFSGSVYLLTRAT
jgi:malonate transporter